jgi:hypothetical protein
MVLYWLVHAYSSFAEHRVEQGEPLTFRRLARTLAAELMIVAGAAIPLLAVLSELGGRGSLIDRPCTRRLRRQRCA